MDRYWLLTWTTYGTWLPGDPRGFVSEIRDPEGNKVLHNSPHTPCDADLPNLQRFSRESLKGEPVYLDAPQAEAVLGQFRETAHFRGWELRAAVVMANHVHLVVGVPGDPDPEKLLGDFKAYATRRLKKNWPVPTGGRWWTQSGSRRKLPSDEAVLAAIEYVKNQHRPLALWVEVEATGGLTPCRSPPTPAG